MYHFTCTQMDGHFTKLWWNWTYTNATGWYSSSYCSSFQFYFLPILPCLDPVEFDSGIQINLFKNQNQNFCAARKNKFKGVLVLLKCSRFPETRQQTCHPHDKNCMILQWKVYVKWTSTFCEKTDDVYALARVNKISAKRAHPRNSLFSDRAA